MTYMNPAFAPIELKSADDGDNADLVTKALGDLTASFETKLKEIETKSADRLNRIEARLNRPGAVEQKTQDKDVEAKAAFLAFARRGVERMGADEVKALTVSTDSAGGYLVPDATLSEIDKLLVLYSPIRNVARLASTSVPEILLPKRTGTLTASWVGETTPRQATQPAYGQQKFVMHELACYVDVSNRLLEDSMFNLEGELARDFAEEFGRAESVAFMLGDGVDKPNGLLTNDEIETVETAAAGTVTADDLIEIFHALPSFYAANGSWLMSRATIGKVRKLKASDGHYIWTDTLTAGNPATILGRPVIEMPDMPGVATGEIPVAFGDFSAGFRIFDRTSMAILRDPYTVQTTGQVRFHARRRVGGAVSKAEAIKFLTVK